MDTPAYEQAVSDTTLRRYLAGALTPARREEIDAVLRGSPALMARLATLSASTVGEELGAWRVPPPGARSLMQPALELRRAAAMGDEDADYLELRLDIPEGAHAHRLALLAATDGEWEVLLPERADEDRPLATWPREADGRLRLDLDIAGLSRLAVAFLPPDLDIDWSDTDRWAELRAGLAAGRVPVMSVRVGRDTLRPDTGARDDAGPPD